MAENITKIDYECEVSSNALIFKIIYAIFTPFTKSIMRKQFDALKKLVEKSKQ